MTQLLLMLLNLYKMTAPFRRFFTPPLCRFYPTCSVYMGQALVRHGLVSGLRLGILRLLKCHPLHPGGIDLLPSTYNQEIPLCK